MKDILLNKMGNDSKHDKICHHQLNIKTQHYPYQIAEVSGSFFSNQ